MKKVLAFITGMLPYGSLLAQQEVEMADGLRAEGKIYVIVAIILIILAGLVVYLVLLDKKIKRLEDSVEEKLPQTTTIKK